MDTLQVRSRRVHARGAPQRTFIPPPGSPLERIRRFFMGLVERAAWKCLTPALPIGRGKPETPSSPPEPGRQRRYGRHYRKRRNDGRHVRPDASKRFIARGAGDQATLVETNSKRGREQAHTQGKNGNYGILHDIYANLLGHPGKAAGQTVPGLAFPRAHSRAP